jgi:hypothetical protein
MAVPVERAPLGHGTTDADSAHGDGIGRTIGRVIDTLVGRSFAGEDLDLGSPKRGEPVLREAAEFILRVTARSAVGIPVG